MAKAQWNKEYTENFKTSKHLRYISSKHGTQMDPKLYNALRQKHMCTSSAASKRTLWIEQLSLSFRKKQQSKLWVWIWKENIGAYAGLAIQT